MEHLAISQGVVSAVDQLLAPFVIRCFFVFGIVAFAVGVGLIFSHARMHQLFGYINNWVSTRHSSKWLAIPRDVGPAVHRFRHPLGAVFVLVAAYSTFILLTRIDADQFVTALNLSAPHAFVVWIVECVRLFMILGGMVAIAAGLMLLFSPRTLDTIEAHANHWYSVRRVSLHFDTMHMGVDNWVESHPGLAGWLIAVPALFVVVDAGLLLFANK